MVFIPKEHFEKLEKEQEIAEKVEAKRVQHVVNKEAKPAESLLRNVMQKTSPAPRPQRISIKDIETEMKVHDLIESRKKEQIDELLRQKETVEIKDEVLDVMAMPHTHPDKKKIFKYKLSNSEVINQYVDDNVIFRFFNKANSHIKFGTLYAIKYLQTHREYNEYIHSRRQVERHTGEN